MIEQGNFTGEQKLMNLLKSIVKISDETEEIQIGRSRKTYEPIYGKSIKILLPNETIEEMRRTLKELSEVEE